MSSRFSVSLEGDEDDGETTTNPNPNPNPNPKRIKLEEEEDGISGLPDAILVHILSLLPTTGDAIRTGVLSKRWKYLWTSLPNLAFSFDTSPRHVDNFIQSVDKTLALCSHSLNINKLSLQISCYRISETQTAILRSSVALAKLQSSVPLWLRFAAARNLEQLCLDVSTDQVDPNFVMPEFLYRHPCFTQISTSGCDYPLPSVSGQVSWGLLKELIVEDAGFEDGALQTVLLGCPLLECLELRRCSYFPNIDTASNLRLKRLVLEELVYNGPKFGNLEISIPNVTSLEILGCWHCTQFKLLNVSSLVDVTLDFSHFDVRITLPQCCRWVWQLLENVNHVNNLTLGSWCIQILSVAMAKALCPPLSENNCTCLTLTTGFEKCDFLGVARLLRSSPYLEKLVVHRAVDYYCSLKEVYNVNCHISKDYWKSQAGSFYCLQRLLKTIQVVGLGRQSYRREYLLEFVKFLLRSAKVLEKLVILAPRGTQRKMDNFYRMSQQILSFPKSSAQVVVLLT